MLGQTDGNKMVRQVMERAPAGFKSVNDFKFQLHIFPIRKSALLLFRLYLSCNFGKKSFVAQAYLNISIRN